GAGPGGRLLAGLAGVLFGLCTLIRFDSVRELLLLIPVLGWLAARRRPQWTWLAGGVLAGGAFGLVDALGPSRSYVAAVLYLLRPVLVVGPLLLVGTVGAVLLLRRHPVPDRLRRRFAIAGGVVTVLIAGFLAARPWLQTAHQVADDSTPILAGMQREQQLPVDGSRTYAEQSVRWLSWYVGWGTIALAAAAAAVLVWAALRGRADRWALALPLPLASAALVLYRPAITPDHPWADRRLVPTVLPTATLLAVAAVAALTRAARHWATQQQAARLEPRPDEPRLDAARLDEPWLDAARPDEASVETGLAPADQPRSGQPRSGQPGSDQTRATQPRAGRLRSGWRPRAARLAAPAVALAGVAGLVLPAVATTRPMLGLRTEQGEAAAVDTACAAFGPGDVALAIDARTRQELVPALRLICEVPTYAVPGEPTDDTATPAQLAAAVTAVRAAGGRPVLVAQSAEPLPKLTHAPQRRVAALDTEEQQRLLTRPPRALAPLRVEIWVAPAD
ncbi:MAG TPA: hypothetical protein VMU51_07990, partial [Mycobacteriales bacterium]|nr:hypothetical protein [Mycobacteriales bacterium]